MAAILLFGFWLFLIIAQIFFLIQLTEAGIHLLNPSTTGFLITANPLAWILVFILMAMASGALRWIFKWANLLAATGLTALFETARKDAYSSIRGALWTVRVFWIVATILLTGAAFDFFRANPQLNGWLSEAGILAHVLVYLGIFGIVANFGKKDKPARQIQL